MIYSLFMSFKGKVLSACRSFCINKPIKWAFKVGMLVSMVIVARCISVGLDIDNGHNRGSA